MYLLKNCSFVYIHSFIHSFTIVGAVVAFVSRFGFSDRCDANTVGGIDSTPRKVGRVDGDEEATRTGIGVLKEGDNGDDDDFGDGNL
jgi:hypothetical protein